MISAVVRKRMSTKKPLAFWGLARIIASLAAVVLISVSAGTAHAQAQLQHFPEEIIIVCVR
jgi:hypothetical protein